MRTFIYGHDGNVAAILDLTMDQLAQLEKIGTLCYDERYLGAGHTQSGWQEIATFTPKDAA